MEKYKYYRLEPKKIKTFGIPHLEYIQRSMVEVLNDMEKTDLCSKYKECLGIKTKLDKYNMNYAYPKVPVIVRYDGKSYEDIITTIEINPCDLFDLVELPLANFDDIETYELDKAADYDFYTECIKLLVDISTVYRKVSEPFYEEKETNYFTIGLVSSKRNKYNPEILQRINYIKQKMSKNGKIWISKGNISCDCFDGEYDTVPIVVTASEGKCHDYWTEKELPIDGLFVIKGPISSEELRNFKPGVANYTYEEAVNEFINILIEYNKSFKKLDTPFGISRTRKSNYQSNQN